MTVDNSYVSQLIKPCHDKWALNFATTLLATLLISLLAQISIPLAHTPVPITGQTFGVALVSLLWGSRRAVSAVALYLSLGYLGWPLFAFSQSGLILGPTSGYLLGMLIASFVMGTFADRGWTESFWKTWVAAVLGSGITFCCGLIVLSLFVPASAVLIAGVFPFLPGDIIKTILVCFIVRSVKGRVVSC